MDYSEPPGWEQQDDNERRRWLEDYSQHDEKGNDMANINDVFNTSNYLKTSDLRGQSHMVTIDVVDVKEFKETEDGGEVMRKKLVIHFKGKPKSMVCNKTNAGVIASSYGDDTNGWLGKPIELFPQKVPFGSQMVDAIRVRVPIPAAPIAPAHGSDDFEDDIPF